MACDRDRPTETEIETPQRARTSHGHAAGTVEMCPVARKRSAMTRRLRSSRRDATLSAARIASVRAPPLYDRGYSQ